MVNGKRQQRFPAIDLYKGRLFVLKVRQQPERARLCSFKEENDTIDRRPVDPPPVVQVLTPRSDPATVFESTSFFIRASIVHPTPSISLSGEEEYLPVKTPTGADATAGEVIQTPEKLKGLDGVFAALVIFAKLSVRVPGIFRLKFTLYNTSSSGVEEITSTVSDTFEVFSPKLFKGMRESTPLTRHLASQGLKVKLRTDTTVGRQSDSRKRANPPTRHSATSTPVRSPSPTPRQVIGTTAGLPLRHPGPVRHRSIHNPPILDSSSPPSHIQSQGHSRPSPSTLRTHPHSQTHSHPHAHHPYHSPAHSTSGYRSAPPPPPGRSLVWHPALSHHFPESSSSRGSSPVPHTRPKLRGDDGFMPSLREISSRFDYTPTPPSADLSVFSLSHDKRSDSTSTSTTISSSRPGSTSRQFSPFNTTSSGSTSNTSWQSSRADTPGDDGIPILPSFLRSAPLLPGGPSNGPVLPPPLPSFINSNGLPVISPPPLLPPIRHPDPKSES